MINKVNIVLSRNYNTALIIILNLSLDLDVERERERENLQPRKGEFEKPNFPTNREGRKEQKLAKLSFR